MVPGESADLHDTAIADDREPSTNTKAFLQTFGPQPDWPHGRLDDFLSQMARLNETYPGKGGLFEYLKRARELLADSKEGVNPFSGWTPEVAS